MVNGLPVIKRCIAVYGVIGGQGFWETLLNSILDTSQVVIQPLLRNL